MNTKTPECWASDPNARGVKIELSAERSLLLPFDQFAFAELKIDANEQKLHIIFATHEVLLLGFSLRRIEAAMQRRELSLRATLPISQRTLVPDGQPLIVEIVVKETKDAEKLGFPMNERAVTRVRFSSPAAFSFNFLRHSVGKATSSLVSSIPFRLQSNGYSNV